VNIMMTFPVPLNQAILDLLHRYRHFNSLKLGLIYLDLVLRLLVLMIGRMNVKD
jgi:hypothetical protein